MTERSWTYQELQAELREFERQLRAAGLKPNSIKTYTDRANTFLRWLVGDFKPRGPAG